jgi:hypothetical protein
MKLFKLLTGALAALAFTSCAFADLVKFGDYPADGPRPGGAGEATETAWVSDLLGTELSFIGKFGNDGVINEDPYGALAAMLVKIQNYEGEEDLSVDLWWDLSGTGWQLWAVLLKGGQNDSLWVSTEDQRVMSFDWQTATKPAPTGISHVSIFGLRTTTVPDGASTAALLGLGLVGLSFIARRRKA